MGRVENKVAIVTGAASGLGFAAAQKLMDEGAKVLLTDINEEVINSMPERLSNYSETQFHTAAVSYTHLTLPRSGLCRWRWSPGQ